MARRWDWFTGTYSDKKHFSSISECMPIAAKRDGRTPIR